MQKRLGIRVTGNPCVAGRRPIRTCVLPAAGGLCQKKTTVYAGGFLLKLRIKRYQDFAESVEHNLCCGSIDSRYGGKGFDAHGVDLIHGGKGDEQCTIPLFADT